MKCLLLSIFVTFSLTCFSQDELMISAGERSNYIEHKVKPKETFYSLGRLYNAHPKSIASFNRMDMNKGMAIGQVIRIPLSDTNFKRSGNSGAPVYYKPSASETVSAVSKKFNVREEDLRGWNGTFENEISTGSKVIIGFLHSTEMKSVTIERKQGTIPQNKSVENTLPGKQPAETITAKTDEVKQPEAVAPKTEEKMQPVISKTEEKPVVQFAKQEEKAADETGYFRSVFEQQVKVMPVSKEQTVTSGVFKTTSGWLDGKYYLLIDGVSPGTIVKITNPTSNKTIYAKVLGQMSGIRLNDGLNIRISSAAASVLQVADEDKFILKVNY